jgi:hypothetical protein
MSKNTLTLTPESLQTRCAYWRQVLGLSHWEIAVKIVRERDMNSKGCSGENNFNLFDERALITLVDPVDYPDTPFEQDMEKTLVHELLHITVEYFTRNIPEDSLEYLHREAAITRIADALITLQRNQ